MRDPNLIIDRERPQNQKKDTFWSRYKNSISFKSDLKHIFFRADKRFATLDGARALTILLMVLFHVLLGIVRLLDAHVDAFIQGFPTYLNWIWQAQGSDPLFVVCGLLVSYTLFREYDKNHSIDIIRFYRRRMYRIYPLFLLGLIIFLPTHRDHFDYLLSNLVFVSNLFPDKKPIIPVAWSLEVQVQFYFLLPFLCLLMYAIRKRILLLVSLCLAAVVYRYWVVSNTPELYLRPLYELLYDREFGRLLSDKLYYDLDVRIGAFLMGMLVAYLHHYHSASITAFFKRQPVVNGLILIAAIWLLIWSFSYPLMNKMDDFYAPFDPNANLWYLVLNRYAYCLSMSTLMLLALCPVGLSNVVKWILSWPIWYPFGQLIYSIYIFHFIFIAVGAVIVFGTTDKDAITSVTVSQVFTIYGLAMFFTLIFGSLVHIYIEKPFLKIRDL